MEGGLRIKAPGNEGPAVEIKESPTEQVTEKSAAKALQERLIKFASSETKEREQALPELVEFVMNNTNREILALLVDKEVQKQLEEIVARTNRITFEKYDGTTVKPWTGEHTVIALGEDGKVGAAVSVQGKVWDKYGDLNKYGLVKALCQLHLSKAEMVGDLGYNFEYFAELGLKPGENFFAGSDAKRAQIGNKNFFIAGSGCALKEDYLSELLAGAKPEIDTQAGRSESVFCILTARYIENPNSPAIIQEPRQFRDLRVNN